MRIVLLILLLLILSLIWLQSHFGYVGMVVLDIISFAILRGFYELLLMRAYKADTVSAPRTVSINDSTILIETPSSSATVKWEKVTRIEETPAFTNFVVTKSSGVFIPHHAFKNHEARSTFVDAAKQYWHQATSAEGGDEGQDIVD